MGLEQEGRYATARGGNRVSPTRLAKAHSPRQPILFLDQGRRTEDELGVTLHHRPVLFDGAEAEDQGLPCRVRHALLEGLGQLLQGRRTAKHAFRVKMQLLLAHSSPVGGWRVALR